MGVPAAAAFFQAWLESVAALGARAVMEVPAASAFFQA